MKLAVASLAVIAVAACSSPSGQGGERPVDVADTARVEDSIVVEASEPADAATCGCSSYGAPTTAGTIAGAEINELSGLAASRTYPGVLWAHNDSGDKPRIFGITDKGGYLGEVMFKNASALDWEDIALGPCPKGTCVYVGDIGDNGVSRLNVALYRIPEPNGDKAFGAITADAEILPFAYPDGAHNAEALLVHPTTGEIVIVTKGATAGIYRFPMPLTPGVKATLVKVGAVTGLDGVVTGADASPCGDRVLVRTYTNLFEFNGATIGDALLGPAKRVPVASEGQGEAVAYRADGRGYFTASEGASVSLHATACQ